MKRRKTITTMHIIITSALFMFCCLGNAVASPEVDKEKLNTKLKQIYELDQKYRFKIDSLTKVGASNDLISNAFIVVMEQDKKNQEIVLPIVDIIIRDNINDLDSVSYKTCYLVIQHASTEIQNKYSEFIFYLYKNGQISSVEYMWFIDRLNVGKNKAQKYGLQAFYTLASTLILYPISDQYKKSWEELGVEFTEKAWESINHPPVIISDGEFAILGSIIEKSELDLESNVPYRYIGVEGVKIMINDSVYTVTDKFGYFCFTLDKKAIPSHIYIITETDKFDYRIENGYNTDFIMITYKLNAN